MKMFGQVKISAEERLINVALGNSFSFVFKGLCHGQYSLSRPDHEWNPQKGKRNMKKGKKEFIFTQYMRRCEGTKVYKDKLITCMILPNINVEYELAHLNEVTCGCKQERKTGQSIRIIILNW